MTVQDISVIIPTYNRCRLLERILPTYFSQPEVSEIIVIDDCSDDGTLSLLNSWSVTESRLVTMHLPVNCGPVSAVNIGIEKAKGAYAFLSDDDVELTDNFFGILKAHLENEGADLMAARRIWLHPWEDKEGARRRADAKRGTFLSLLSASRLGDAEMGGKTDLDVPVLPAQVLVRRKVFETVRFDEGYLGYPFRVETDFSLSAKAQGFRLMFCPHAVCFHLVSPSYVRRKIRSQLAMNKWILRNHCYFLKKHHKNLHRFMHVNSSVARLMLEFALERLVGEVRNAVHFGVKWARTRFKAWSPSPLPSPLRGEGRMPRIALLYPALFKGSPGGTEVIGGHLRRVFPGSEILTIADCSSSILCRLRLPWFGIDELLQAVAVGRYFFKQHRIRRFDAVIASGIMGLYLTFRRPHIPVVNSFPATMIGLLDSKAILGWKNRMRGYFLCLFEAMIGRRKDCCVAISERVKSELKRFYGIESYVIPNGVDLGLFTLGDKYLERQKLNLPSRGIVALFVGRPDYTKGSDVFFDVAGAFPQVTFVLVSPRSFDGIRPPNVIVRCNITHFEVAQHYRAADFLIYPSRSESCLCNTILEAMASNLPLIVTRDVLHSLPQGVDPENLGIVVDGYRADLYTEAVRKFIAAPLAVNTRPIVERNFSLELFGDRYQQLIQRLLDKG